MVNCTPAGFRLRNSHRRREGGYLTRGFNSSSQDVRRRPRPLASSSSLSSKKVRPPVCLPLDFGLNSVRYRACPSDSPTPRALSRPCPVTSNLEILQIDAIGCRYFYIPHKTTVQLCEVHSDCKALNVFLSDIHCRIGNLYRRTPCGGGVSRLGESCVFSLLPFIIETCRARLPNCTLGSGDGAGIPAEKDTKTR